MIRRVRNFRMARSRKEKIKSTSAQPKKAVSFETSNETAFLLQRTHGMPYARNLTNTTYILDGTIRL